MHPSLALFRSTCGKVEVSGSWKSSMSGLRVTRTHNASMISFIWDQLELFDDHLRCSYKEIDMVDPLDTVDTLDLVGIVGMVDIVDGLTISILAILHTDSPHSAMCAPSHTLVVKNPFQGSIPIFFRVLALPTVEGERSRCDDIV